MSLYINYPSWITPEIIPGIPLRWYGLMYIVAFGITYLLCKRYLKTHKLGSEINQDSLVNLFFWTIFSLLIGARLFAAIFYDPSGKYLQQPWLIFWPFDGNGNFIGLQGMSYHGGLVGGVIGVILFSRKNRFSVLEVGDMLTTSIPLGYTFGRLGNFFNGELYGRVTTSWYGMLFPTARRFPASEEWVKEVAAQVDIPVIGTMINLPRHPSQLYEAFLEGIVLFSIMWFVFRKRKPFPGFMIGLYLVGYGTLRFLAEYSRQPDTGLGYIIDLSGKNPAPFLFETFFAFSMGQIFCLLMIISGLILWFLLNQYNKKTVSRVETFQPGSPKKISRSVRKKLR
ncbi:MAG: prolipoprotein diacylglyceryl transferase [Spirochaetaceae bacterium]|nr:MAG: prolipoprotein diacylglyceryl transferase [Spirochaetaceae bacterium]